MSSSDFTVWKLKDRNKNYDSLKENFETNAKNLNEEKYPNFSILEENEDTISIKGSDVKYTSYTCSITVNYLIGAKSDFILIIYKLKNDQVGFIIQKNSNALSFLRTLCGYTKSDRKTIVSVFEQDSDYYGAFLFWIVSKIYNNESNLTYDYDGDKSINIELASLDSIKGRTNSLVKVSTSGNHVMNMLTTLSFLMESERLTETSLNTSYGDHNNIAFSIKNGGNLSIGITFEDYYGSFTKQIDLSKGNNEVYKILHLKIAVFVCLELLPTLITIYATDEDAENVKKKLAKKVINDDLSKKIEELKDRYNIE
ncbi:hypothetical protein [Apilactobacillus bombintestini]|uniref:Uncharacterized protein n=1 Tax=Apilactobacillus bombintestini TaxID=2419772 RepID=A0A387AUQ2_9LACO|nr:hypothetical protein [Apilactobacillus bombintestini]AYF93069.1 hypothetical protein D7I45_06135 [Apilactobacillus bombintestini]